MSEATLLKLAESGEWKERAINLLQRKTKACLEIILQFVECYWENLLPDEDNLYNFSQYEAEHSEVFAY